MVYKIISRCGKKVSSCFLCRTRKLCQTKVPFENSEQRLFKINGEAFWKYHIEKINVGGINSFKHI